jgi:hypothetical protein
LGYYAGEVQVAVEVSGLLRELPRLYLVEADEFLLALVLEFVLVDFEGYGE